MNIFQDNVQMLFTRFVLGYYWEMFDTKGKPVPKTELHYTKIDV